MELMADRAMRILDASTVLVLRERDGDLYVAASVGKGSVSASVMKIEGTALGELYRAQEPLELERPLRDQAAFLRELGLEAQSVVLQPLVIEGAGGGLLLALRASSGLRSGDQNALQAVAARLARELQAEREAELERLRYGAHAREHERERWARELHDETVQGMGALRMQLGNALDDQDEEAVRVAARDVFEGLQREIMGLRHMITELRPAALDDLGLEAALEALARRAEAVYGLKVDVDVRLGGESGIQRLDGDLETTVYRIVQEALNNVARHAEATKVSVTVVDANGTLVATVADDGKGMSDTSLDKRRREEARAESGEEPSAVPTGGYGLPGMRERAELVGGELELRSAPGEGTELRLVAPIIASAEQPLGVES